MLYLQKHLICVFQAPLAADLSNELQVWSGEEG